ncbi:MAG: HAMP domain-containing histidine kinase, partial [Solirubrobacteraceae bacterium]|nr:HAMP domain-containing histidine kinase [Solirubrobacteraceae bacterium]
AEIVDPRRGPPGRGRPGRATPLAVDPADDLLGGSGSFVQLEIDGAVVARRGDVPDDPPAVPEADGLATIDVDGEPWRSLTVSGPVAPVRVQLLTSLAPVEARVADARRLIIVAGLGALAVTALAAWGFTTLAVRPLRRLQAGAERVRGATDLDAWLPADDGPVEVRALAATLNDMLARLGASTAAMERALEATRRFAADAGHELRTPLTGLRANLDTLARNPGLPADQRQALIGELTAEQERIVHLLEGLQALARGDAAQRLPREPVDLADLADAAVHTARRRHPGVAVALDADETEARVTGWPDGLRLVLDNLLDNAARHGRPGGRVRVRVARDGDRVRLRVEDDGPGVPAPERERLLRPFERGAGATAPGSGLGLAIVAQQVALHGGAIALGDAALGGLAVEVDLPAAAPSARTVN